MKHRVLYHYGSSHYDTGSPRALVGLVGLLDRDRFQPLFLPAEHGPLVDAIRERGVEILAPGSGRPRSVSKRSLGSGLRRVDHWCDRLTAEGVDLLHLNEVGWNTDLVLAAWLVGVPVVLHAHNPARMHARNLNIAIASRVIIPSRNHQTAIHGYERIADKCTVIYNTTVIDKDGAPVRVRHSLGLHDRSPIILTVAQISHRKGIDMLLEVAPRVWKEIPDAVFLIAGPDAVNEGAFADHLRSEVRHMGIGERIRFLGSRNDIHDLLSASDLFFLPSRAEPFGIVFLEAMFAGVPVVASRVGGIPEVVAPPEGGLLVDDYAPQSFAAALGRLLQDHSLRERISATAKERAESVFGYEQLSGVLTATYHDLLAQPPKGVRTRSILGEIVSRFAQN